MTAPTSERPRARRACSEWLPRVERFDEIWPKLTTALADQALRSPSIAGVRERRSDQAGWRDTNS